MSFRKKAHVSGSLLAAFAAVGVLTTAANAQDTLRWKFKPGKTLNYSIVHNMNMSMMVMGQNIDMKMKQTMDLVWKVTKVDSSGTADMAQTITRVQMEMTGGPIGKLEYDSAKPNAGGGNPAIAAMAKMFDALVGNAVTMKMTALGEIKDVKMPKKFLDATKGAGGGALPGMMSADSLKDMMAKSSLTFPKTGLKVGQTWSKEVRMDNPFGTIKVNTAYKYGGNESKGGKTLAKIAMTPKMSIVPKPGAMFAIKLGKQSGKGMANFDVNAGHLVGTTSRQKMVMEITVAGQTLEQTIEQTTEMKLVSNKTTR